MNWTPRTLKGQLTALFLVLTLIPAMVLTVVATRQTLNALARWENPGVQRALSGSLEVARDLMNRTKNDLRQRGQLLAADAALQPPISPDAAREWLATAANLDFVQVYSPEGELLFETTRDPFLPSPGVLAPLDPSRQPFLEDKEQSLLAYVGVGGSPGEEEWILVVGMYLDQNFYTRLDDLSRAHAYYLVLPNLIQLKQRTVVLFLTGLAVGLAGLSIWIARRLAGRVSGPVRDLGKAMEQLTGGEDTVQVKPGGTEEMERLMATFNSMSTELSRSRRELAQAERLSAWRDVARRVAHEMKNALTPITFSAHRLKKAAAALPEDEQPRYQASVQTVLEEVEGLKRLAASFSELARLPVAEFATLDLTEMIQVTVDAFAGESNRVQWNPPSETVRIEGDRTLLRQALTNLVKNAVEASEGNGRVWVALHPEAAGARLVVEDEGHGWPEGDRERAMDPYFTTKSEGTGLGLSLVQRTLLQHGGTMQLEDRPEGGARVTLLLPYRFRRDADRQEAS